MYILRKIQ